MFKYLVIDTAAVSPRIQGKKECVTLRDRHYTPRVVLFFAAAGKSVRSIRECPRRVRFILTQRGDRTLRRKVADLLSRVLLWEPFVRRTAATGRKRAISDRQRVQ